MFSLPCCLRMQFRCHDRATESRVTGLLTRGFLKMPATVWKGYLSFGLVSFPVRLFAAARAEPARFSPAP